MSLSIKTPINIPKNNCLNINENKFKERNAPINVKMCQIPNNWGIHNKVKTNIISSSYFNLNIKNKTNLLLNKEKIKKGKKDRNKLSKDIKTNYYSLIIPNNIKTNNNSNNVTRNIYSNYSQLSINSLLTNSINKSKNLINSRKQNLINSEYSIINKQNNYSFKIKVNTIKEQLISDNTRNNSLKNHYNSNDIDSNINNINDFKKDNTIIKNKYIYNGSSIKKISRNKKNMSTNINKIIYQEKKDNEKSYSVKSVFKKIDFNTKNNTHKNTLFISYSEKEKNKEKIKRKIINNSHLILNNNYLSSFKKLDISNKIKDKNKFRIHTRNNTTSYNGKNINDFFYGKKLIYNNIDNKKNCNQTKILSNAILDNFKKKNKFAISPKIKYDTNIINNKDFSHLINYNSISNNINSLKNIIYKNNYNSNDNVKSHKKRLIKEIPAPKINKNKKKVFHQNENSNNVNYIKEISIKKISKKKIKGTRNSVKIKKNKTTIKLNEEKNSINLKKDNYDRDDLENENINIIKDYNNKISIVEILKKDKINDRKKTFASKKIKSIRIEKKNSKTKNNKKKKYIKDINNINSNNLNSNNKIVNNNINYMYDNNRKIINNKIHEIMQNKIENKLFDESNLMKISSDNEDNFDDLYSIIKQINFNSVLLNNDGIFSENNKEYKNYIKIFDNNYYKKTKQFNTNYFKYTQKMNSKYCTESTKVNSTSSKKISFLKDNNEKYIHEFKLENSNKNKNYSNVIII